jgi:hypothetical protein
MEKSQDDYHKVYDAFDGARSKLEDAIQDFEDATFENGLKTNRAAYEMQDLS